MDAEAVARFLVLSAANRLICCDWQGGKWKNTGQGGTTHGGEEFCTPVERVAEAVEVSGAAFWGGAVGDRCPLFVELCCGSAAVTLRLLGGPYARPPVSYMGAKTGYAPAILHALGLRQGQGAAAVLLNDPGPWSKVWACLVDPEGCRRVAAIIRGWIGEDARALWERLRAESVPEDEGEAAAARWVWVQGLQWASSGNIDPVKAGEGWTDKKGRAWGKGLDPFKWLPERHDALSRLTFPPSTLVLGEDAAEIEPRDVARWVWLAGNAYRRGDPSSGFDDAQGRVQRGEKWGADTTAVAIAACERPIAWPPAAVSNLPAQDIHPEPPLPEGTVLFLDPPYFGDGSRKITGYAHEFPRSAVVEVALRWQAAGARVAVSECVPVPELVDAGWHTLDITATRIGQRRTFGGTPEWLTLSHPPAWTPPVQADLLDP